MAKEPQKPRGPKPTMLPPPPPLGGETASEYTRRTGFATLKIGEDPLQTITRLRQSLCEARELIEELAAAGVEFEDERIKYKVVQVPTVVLDAARKWLEENGDEG